MLTDKDFMQQNDIEKLKQSALQGLGSADNEEDLEQWRIRFLGRKGEISTLMRGLSSVSETDRAVLGSSANELKLYLQQEYEVKKNSLSAKYLNESHDIDVDITLPARKSLAGTYHPTTRIVNEIAQVFSSMGFDIAEGPEVETDEYNFQKLNIPSDHPARDMWNSLWVKEDNDTDSTSLLMRTHTSPMQIRIMENMEPPVRVIVPGKTYRYEATDATHEWQFCQIEGLAVAEDITFANLKATLAEFARRIFGDKRKARFRCDFFPFVEPGAEVSIDCFKCEGEGCRVCGNTGWIEIMGAGMVHPKVLKGVGYDPKKYSGLAFGMGAERIAMLKEGIDDVRLFYSNDLRFLKQFV